GGGGGARPQGGGGRGRPFARQFPERRGAGVVAPAAAARVPARAVDVVAVVLRVLLPVDLADVRGRLDLRLLGLRRLPLLCAVLPVDGRDLGGPLELLVQVLLEDGILGELVINQGLELGPPPLQDLDRLAQLRRHDELLREPLLEDDARVLSHRMRRGGYYSRNFSPRYISRASGLSAIRAGAPSSRTAPSFRM